MLREGKIAEVVRIAHQVILTKVLFDSFLKYTFWRQRYEDELRKIEIRRDSNISRKVIEMKKRNGKNGAADNNKKMLFRVRHTGKPKNEPSY